MLDYRVRNIGAFPHCPTGAKPKVGILAVQEQILIEQPDFVEHRPFIQRGAPAGKQHVGCARVFGRRLEVTALFARSIGAQEHSRRIEQVGTVKPDLRRAHADLVSRLHGAHHRFDPRGVRDRIIVHNGEERRIGSSKCLVYGSPEAFVIAVLDHSRVFPNVG